MLKLPVLGWYIGECMESLIDINIVSKNQPMGIKIVVLVKYRYLVGMSKVRESLYIGFIIWVNIILTHIDTTAILPRYEGFLQMVSKQKHNHGDSCQESEWGFKDSPNHNL